jgi:hypothetical protein
LIRLGSSALSGSNRDTCRRIGQRVHTLFRCRGHRQDPTIANQSHRPASKSIRTVALAIAASIALITTNTGCTGITDGQPNAVFVTTTQQTPTTTIPPGGPTTIPEGSPILRGLCPDPLVVQLDGAIDLWALPWTSMLAIDGTTFDAAYTAEMVHPSNRSLTGVRLELRQTRPTDRSVADILRDDRSVHIGVVSTDVAITQRDTSPLTYLAAPWLRDDRIITWDRAASGGAISFAEIDPKANLKINSTINDPIVAYLVGSNLITKSQITTESGSLLQIERFLDNPEILAAESVAPENSPRGWQFLDETGWSPYPHAVVTNPSALETLRPCLEAVIPLLQKSVVEIRRQPQRMIANLAEIARIGGAPLDPIVAMSRLRSAVDNHFLNSEVGTTVAEITPARIEQTIRADWIRRRAQGLPTSSLNKLRLQAKAIIDDLTDTDVGVSS